MANDPGILDNPRHERETRVQAISRCANALGPFIVILRRRPPCGIEVLR